jgi:hypothetical protein
MGSRVNELLQRLGHPGTPGLYRFYCTLPLSRSSTSVIARSHCLEIIVRPYHYWFRIYSSDKELQKDAIKHLFDVYVNINKDTESDPGVKDAAVAWFKRMEDGDEDALKVWRVWRKLSVKEYAEEYDRLSVHFNVYTGESKVVKK